MAATRRTKKAPDLFRRETTNQESGSQNRDTAECHRADQAGFLQRLSFFHSRQLVKVSARRAGLPSSTHCGQDSACLRDFFRYLRAIARRR